VTTRRNLRLALHPAKEQSNPDNFPYFFAHGLVGFAVQGFAGLAEQGLAGDLAPGLS